MSTNEDAQREVCARFGTPWISCPGELRVGLADNAREALQPLNGLRHPPEGDTTGWYIWAGEVLSEDPDFFKPVCARHLAELCPQALPFLGLPPGWRFLLADNQLDVWEDPSLLNA